jgi:glutaredoxin 3
MLNMNKVEIYTSDTCGYCHEAKDFFDANKIEFIEHNISKDMDSRKALMKKGYMSVPVIVVNGEEILGFDKAKLSSMLGI